MLVRPSIRHFVILLSIGLLSVIYLVLKLSTGYYFIYHRNLLNVSKSVKYENAYLSPNNAISTTNLFSIKNLTESLITKREAYTLADNQNLTIVILTHNRIELLRKNLIHLNGLSKVEKVIVIVNNNKNRQKEFREQLALSPDWRLNTTYKLEMIFAPTNSLNNRFLPLSSITTAAILSLDDDVFVSHAKVLFAFNIWTQFPQQIIGFPSRSHEVNSTNGKFQYVSHPKENVSLILTGFAFFHSKYLYEYTYNMPKEIRNRVDDTTNCEDIAMNFLIGNLTKMPPIKITNDNDWSYQGLEGAGASKSGEESLWKNSTHFEERDECLNYFAEVYGHMPLIPTNFRIESIADLKDENEEPNESFSMKVYRHLTTFHGSDDPKIKPNGRTGTHIFLILFIFFTVIFLSIGTLIVTLKSSDSSGTKYYQ